MPLFGTLDLDVALGDAPIVENLTPDRWTLPGAETMQVSYEVAEGAALAITPPGLHPSIPPYATFSVMRASESPVGPYTLATVRLIVRAGIRPRGLLVGAWCDSPAAADALRSGWGYKVSVADVAFSRRHNQLSGSVTIDGATALETRLIDPEPIAGTDIELFDNLHLVNLADGGGGDGPEPLLVQVDPGYQYQSADRGRAELAAFDAGRLGVDGIEPVYPLIGVACVADVELAAPRFVIDPTVPAVTGTRRLDTASA